MITTNIITASFPAGERTATTRSLYQYDYGQILRFEGLELPQAYEVHFSDKPYSGEATTQIGDADGVTIPDAYLLESGYVYAWIYLHTGEDDGETRYTIKIPVAGRSMPIPAQPDPVQQDAITQAIAALNSAVEQTGQDAENAAASAESAAESAAEAEASADRAEQAAATSGWLYFEIIGGYLWLERTPSTEIDFYLDNGDLYMEAIG